MLSSSNAINIFHLSSGEFLPDSYQKQFINYIIKDYEKLFSSLLFKFKVWEWNETAKLEKVWTEKSLNLAFRKNGNFLCDTCHLTSEGRKGNLLICSLLKFYFFRRFSFFSQQRSEQQIYFSHFILILFESEKVTRSSSFSSQV